MYSSVRSDVNLPKKLEIFHLGLRKTYFSQLSHLRHVCYVVIIFSLIVLKNHFANNKIIACRLFNVSVHHHGAETSKA